jgi:hypothetical protein
MIIDEKRRAESIRVLGFDPYTIEYSVDMRDITPEMDSGSTKSEKGKQMDDDYSRMMQERGNDMGMKSN